jgi:hypothetical protein
VAEQPVTAQSMARRSVIVVGMLNDEGWAAAMHDAWTTV